MTAGADDGRVEFWRLHRSGIVGMFGLGTMAGFAGEHDVLAQFFLLDDVGVADFANVMAGKRDGASGDLGDSCSAIMAILPETARNHRGADGHEEDQRSNHYSGEPN